MLYEAFGGNVFLRESNIRALWGTDSQNGWK